MTRRGAVYFVWVKGHDGPRSMKVCADPDDEPCFDEKLKQHVLSKHILERHQEELSFAQLEALFPPPMEALQ